MRPATRRRLRYAALVAAGLLALDLSRPPAVQWTARALVAAIDAYQATASPLVAAAGVRCRFVPTCSHYGEEAVRRHGGLVGGAKALWRIMRCGPWTEPGTHDPLPPLPAAPTPTRAE